jgi:cold shock CspA family protein
MADTIGKKEKEKQRQQKKKEKEQRKAERQANAKSGSLEDMIAYVDENGNITSTPPDPSKKKTVNESDIVIGSRNIGGIEVDPIRKGRVTFFNTSKGYGFITDSDSQQSVFVHVNALITPIAENDIVTFQIEQGPKGAAAVSVKKI